MLVTGGLGLIGNAVVIKSLLSGDEVTVVDNCSAYEPNTCSDLVKRLGNDVRFLRTSTESERLIEKFSNEKFDIIYNFGSYSSDRYFESAPTDAVDSTVNGLLNMLKIGKALKVGKIVYPSSGTVYGNTPAPQREGQQLSPKTMYAATKTYLEMLSSLERDVSTVGIRIFTGFGARELFKGNLSSVVTLFTLAALNDEKIEVYGDGSQKRDFVEVEDVAEVAYRLARSDKSPLVINCGSGVSFSFNKLINLIKANVNKELKIINVQEKTKFVKETRADIAKLKDAIDFVPRPLDVVFPKYFESLSKLLREIPSR